MPLGETKLEHLKLYLHELTKIPLEGMKLLHSGAVMKDERAILISFGIREGSKILLLGTPKRDAAVSSTSGDSAEHPLLISMRRIQDDAEPIMPMLMEFEEWVYDKMPQLDKYDIIQSHPWYPSDQGRYYEKEARPEMIERVEKRYREINERLMRLILAFDALQGDFNDESREARRSSVQNVQKLLNHLDKLLHHMKE